MNLYPLNIEDRFKFDNVIELYLSSFPPVERRTIIDLIDQINSNDNYTLEIISDDDNNFAGFISMWRFKNFIFIEHFAISSKYRNKGYGKEVLSYLKDREKLPLVGEIEPPNMSPMALRRRNFYERQGFQIWDKIEYFQPSFVKEHKDIPLILISLGSVANEEFMQNKVKNILYRDVYKIN